MAVAVSSDVPSRCGVCGSGVTVQNGHAVCMHDEQHGIAFGGPGSGWHATAGHVPGSQGGSKKEGGSKKDATKPSKAPIPGHQNHLDDEGMRSQTPHAVASRQHSSAAWMANSAAEILSKPDVQTYVNRTNNKTASQHDLAIKDALHEAKIAMQRTKESGAKAFAPDAAAHYMKQAQKAYKAGDKKAAVEHLNNAAQNFEQASKWHAGAHNFTSGSKK